jgi:hypothetical protein
MRIKRSGTGMYDTSYTLSATARNTVVPAEKLSNVSGLIDIKSYYKDRYSGNQSNSAATNSNDTQGVSLDSTDDLFG